MLTQIVLFAILISGSIWASAVCKKRFEDLLPLTCASIVLLLFLCGTLGILKAGVYLVLAISVLLWTCSIIYLLKKRSWKDFRECFVTPAFCLFAIAFVVLIYTNYGMIAAEWDEFSHWADVVKAMVYIDDFGTNPAAHSTFQSYPPGMSLFQYFFQKVYGILNRGESFSEWRLYYSYQIFFLSFLMPFLRELSFENFSVKRIFTVITAAVLCFFGPMLIFNNIYIVILIDAFLGLMTGTGLAMIFVRKNKDWCYDMYLCMNIAILILAKDAGMLFAAFMLAAYIIDILCFRKGKNLKKLFLSIVGTISLLLPKLLWQYNIKSDNARISFSKKIDIKELFKVIVGIDKTSYRVDVVKNFFDRLFTQCFEISVLKIGIPYIVIYAVLILACYGMYRKYKKWNRENDSTRKMIFILLAIETVIYIFGLCVTYMFKFSEYEALGVASFDRYMNIILEGMVVFLLMIVINYIICNQKQKKFEIGVLIIIVALLPWGMIKEVGMRHTVSNTINTRVRYYPIIEQIEEIAEDTGETLKICVISQESAGYDRWILRYSLRPHEIVGSDSIGEPFYEDDIYTEEITVDEWKNELKETADYVALYHLNDYFMEEFAAAFENEEDIHENGVYLVDKTTGMLSLYE